VSGFREARPARPRRVTVVSAVVCIALSVAIPMIYLGFVDAERAKPQTSEPPQEQTIVREGRITSDRPDWVYESFEVPEGVTDISVRYEYNREGGNALDIGVFDPDGYDLGNEEGFRGWSGAPARSSPSPAPALRRVTSQVR